MPGNRSRPVTPNSLTDPHFARITPIVGRHLRRMKAAVVGLPLAEPLVKYLAASGVGHWALLDPTGQQTEQLRAYLLAQHGPALSLDLVACDRPEQLAASQPDLLISAGMLKTSLSLAGEHRLPALLIAPPTVAHPCQAIAYFPGNEPPPLLDDAPGQIDAWGWVTAAPLCAGLGRAILLRQTDLRRPDLADMWQRGLRVLEIGPPDDPLDVRQAGSAPQSPATERTFRTPPGRRGRLLIAGLGSLGSIAATHLARHAAGFILADPDRVDAYNPVRQAYSLAQIGRSKAEALRETLLALGADEVTALNLALADEADASALLKRHQVTAALVVTGAAADFAIARALRRLDIPHLVGRCYPRARYWEAILVNGRRGPGLEAIRGYTATGPAPPPTPEQIAAYSDAGALEAEPATLIESGWAATWLARLAAQFLAPPALRERWFLDLLAAQQTCLVGGVAVQPTVAGPAYAISTPGQIRAWGRQDLSQTYPAINAPAAIGGVAKASPE